MWWPLTTAAAAAEVFDAAVSAGAEEDSVEFDLFHRCSGLEVHVLVGAGEGIAVGLGLCVFECGNLSVDRSRHAGRGSPGNCRSERSSVDVVFAIEDSAFVGRESAPVGDGLVPCCALRGEAAAFEVGEGGLVGGDHAGASTGFDDQVADSVRPSMERARMARPAYSTT